MKAKSFYSLIIFIALLSTTPCLAGNTSPQPIQPQKDLHLKYHGSSNRPGIPANLYLNCTLINGYLVFSFPEEVNSISIFIYNDYSSWSGFVTYTNPQTEIINLSSGKYIIECSTDNGRTFSGSITL